MRWDFLITLYNESFKFRAVRLILLGNDTEHRKSGTATRHSVTQEISRLLCKTKLHYRVYKSLHLIALPLLIKKSEL